MRRVLPLPRDVELARLEREFRNRTDLAVIVPQQPDTIASRGGGGKGTSGAGGGAPVGARYITQAGNALLTAEQSLGALTTGLLKNNVAASVGTLSTAVEGTDYYGPGGTAVAVADGGTGTGTAPANGQLLIGNAGGGYTVASMAAGGAITILAGSGALEIGIPAAAADDSTVGAASFDASHFTDDGSGNISAIRNIEFGTQAREPLDMVDYFVFVVPVSMTGMNLTNVIAGIYTLSDDTTAGNAVTVMVTRNRSGTINAMLSTGVTVSCNATDAEYFASDETIDTSNDDVQTGDIIKIGVSATTITGSPPMGLGVTLTFEIP